MNESCTVDKPRLEEACIEEKQTEEGRSGNRKDVEEGRGKDDIDRDGNEDTGGQRNMNLNGGGHAHKSGR